MSIIKDFTFNGRAASSFGVQLADNSEWWATPERDIEHISVPGRSGDLLIDKSIGQFEIGDTLHGFGTYITHIYPSNTMYLPAGMDLSPKFKSCWV